MQGPFALMSTLHAVHSLHMSVSVLKGSGQSCPPPVASFLPPRPETARSFPEAAHPTFSLCRAPVLRVSSVASISADIS